MELYLQLYSTCESSSKLLRICAIIIISWNDKYEGMYFETTNRGGRVVEENSSRDVIAHGFEHNGITLVVVSVKLMQNTESTLRGEYEREDRAKISIGPRTRKISESTLVSRMEDVWHEHNPHIHPDVFLFSWIPRDTSITDNISLMNWETNCRVAWMWGWNLFWVIYSYYSF